MSLGAFVGSILKRAAIYGFHPIGLFVSMFNQDFANRTAFNSDDHQLLKDIATLKGIVLKAVKKRLQEVEENPEKQHYDLLQIMIEYQKKCGRKSNDQEFFDSILKQFYNFYLAGTDTTGVLLANTLGMICERPDIV